MMMPQQYPFAAIVAQEDMKLALILNLIDPSLGGVLIRGERGTAKSTAVRSLAQLMPRRREIAGCRFGCDPDDEANWCEECKAAAAHETRMGHMRVIELPIGATEDRVVGALDIERALKTGEKRFEPGILADANRNMLYVDEVNLLDDHLVDVLLDAAAMGVNIIEREGVSFSHPSRFALVGTMNPEEGDLRPQLLDRFGLVVEVCGERDGERRAEVVRRRLAYESDPAAFVARFAPEQERLAARIAKASALLPRVRVDDALFLDAARIAIALEVDGHRADIAMIKTARAITAYEGRETVARDDLRPAARLVLPHRLRRHPLEAGGPGADAVSAAVDSVLRETV